MRIALFSARYSGNLGDGLLSLCLARELQRGRPDVEVIICDLAGRTAYGQGEKRRTLALALLRNMPAPARRLVMKVLLGGEVTRRLRPTWAQVLGNVDAVVLGGGNLLADTDLNFPLKIAGLTHELCRARKPFAIFGVGVSSNWSSTGRKLFERALVDAAPSHVAVRDSRSQWLWTQALETKGAARAVVCRDPALLTCDHFPSTSERARVPDRNKRPLLGLNVTHPDEVALHSDRHVMSHETSTRWTCRLVRAALGAGYEVRLFTNGSAKDEVYLRQLASLLPEEARVIARPCSPEELVEVIRTFDVISGHRLHAHIAAFSCRIPSVGYVWDEKLASFFRSVQRDDFVLDPASTSPSQALARISAACAQGVAEDAWLRAISAARDDIVVLIDSLSTTRVRGGVPCPS